MGPAAGDRQDAWLKGLGPDLYAGFRNAPSGLGTLPTAALDVHSECAARGSGEAHLDAVADELCEALLHLHSRFTKVESDSAGITDPPR
jgi:hypothetical protein